MKKVSYLWAKQITNMKLSFLPVLLSLCLTAAAQPSREAIPQVIHTQRATVNIQYGGPTRAEGRSYTFTPTVVIYPDTQLDQASSVKLL